MTLRHKLRHRRSIRLKNYDYGTAGAYFITVCTKDSVCLFGEVIDGEMHLNEYGEIVQDAWDALPIYYAGVESDAFVVMPNHVHGIIVVGAIHEVPQQEIHGITGAFGESAATVGAIHESPLLNRRRMTIPLVLGRFKMLTAKQINELRHISGIPLWQRNYYEHVIRNEESLRLIRQYIADNPSRWTLDPENQQYVPGRF